MTPNPRTLVACPLGMFMRNKLSLFVAALLLSCTVFALDSAQMVRGQAAVDRMNLHRKICGLNPVVLDIAMSEGCVKHAAYLNQNEDQILAGLDAHHEVSTRPGYTAEGAYAGEHGDITYGHTGTSAIDSWMGTYYHRSPILSPGVTKVGYGDDPGSKTGYTIAVLQFQTYTTLDDTLCPARDSKGNQTHGNREGEVPSPIPNFSNKNGYPIIAYFKESNPRVGLISSSVTAVGAQLSHTAISPNHPQNADFEGNAICLITDDPLPVNTLITVTLNYQLNGAQTLTWSFTTSKTGEFDPDEAGGTPAPTPSGGSGLLTVSKSTMKFNFKDHLKDSMQLSGMLQTAGSAPVAANVQITLAGMTRNYTLDSKGKMLQGGETFALKGKNKDGVFTVNDVTFSLTMKKEDVWAMVKSLGFTNETVSGEAINMPVEITINGMNYAGAKMLTYNAKQDIVGTAK